MSIFTSAPLLWRTLISVPLLFAVPVLAQQAGTPGDEIPNTAFIDFQIGDNNRTTPSNTVVDAYEITRAPNNRTSANVDFLHYAPGDGTNGLQNGNVDPAQCSTGTTMPRDRDGNNIDLTQPVDLAAREAVYHKLDPVFIRLIDQDQNINLLAPDTVTVTVRSDTGDSEEIVLTETGADTGEFIGGLNTDDEAVVGSFVTNNCVLTVKTDGAVTVDYVDPQDLTDIAGATALVDPFGTVFNSQTGEPVSGARVRIARAGGADADVTGDDGSSVYPSTVISGGAVTDSGGTQYDFETGDFRFPFVEGGQEYILIIEDVPPGFRLRPSTVPIDQLRQLSQNYNLDENASFGQPFNVPVGPALNIDIPLDPINTPLFIAKRTSADDAAIGDFVKYEVTVTNANLTDDDTENDNDTAVGVEVNDRLPSGFRLQSGSVQIRRGGSTENFVDPVIGSDQRTLAWNVGDLGPGESATISYIVSITSAVRPGNAINTAQAESNVTGQQSNIAEARVRIREDLFRSTNVIIGRVIIGSCDKSVDNDEIGLPGVRLFMEDGRWVTTDDDGRYNFEGISNQVHVVQVDVDSIPDEYEIVRCDDDSRSAGRAYSRFVDLSGGKLWREEFYVREKIAARGKFTLELTSEPTKTKASLEFVDRVARPNFDTLKADLKPEDQTEIIKLLAGIQDPRGVRVRVVGHTDSRRINGKAAQELFADNYELSRARAESVVMFIRERLKLDDWQIVAEGRGADEPLVPNTGKANWAQNRRVEIRLWGDDVVMPEFAQESITFKLKMQGSSRGVDQNKPVVLHGLKSSVVLPSGVQFVPGSVLRDGESYRDPIMREGGQVVTFERGTWVGDRTEMITFQAVVNGNSDEKLMAAATARFATSRQGKLDVTPAVFNEFIAPTADSNKVERIVLPAAALQNAGSAASLENSLAAVIQRARNSGIGIGGLRFQIVGHANATTEGDARLESESLALAAQVGSYLKDRLNLNAQQLTVIGMGAKRPFAGNTVGKAAEFNNRIEVISWVDSRLANSGIQTVQGMDSRAIETEEEYISEVDDGLDLGDQVPEIIEQLPPQYQSREFWQGQDDSLAFVWPPVDYSPQRPSTALAVKSPAGLRVVVEVNGRRAEKRNYEGRFTSPNQKIVLESWTGHELVYGPNTLTAILFNKQGEEVERTDYNVHVGGRPVRVEWVAERSKAEVDGRNRPVLAFKMYDRWSKPARPGSSGTFSVQPPHRSWYEVMQLKNNPSAGRDANGSKYTISPDGHAYIQLEPTLLSGDVVFEFDLGSGKDQEVLAYLQPKPRDWIMVGVANGTVGYNRINDNVQQLGAGEGDRYYNDGRVAFYASGKVKGEWLLSLAYDSSKQRLEESQSLLGQIDPDEYYTLYNDTSEQGYAASSSDKLFIKLERKQFFALYGDYTTDLTVSELSRYSRTLTGFKSVYRGETFEANVFAAETRLGFVRDEISGDGTSGLYQLSASQIVFNSDKIAIEIRDRLRSEEIIDRRELTRHIDYNIDFDDGTLFFREPIFSRDEDFNPIVIVAEYETLDDSKRQLVVGGRVGAKLQGDRIKVGITALNQEVIEGNDQLIGADAEIRLSNSSILRLEAATTDRDSANGIDAEAYKAELEFNGSRASGEVYYHQQSDGFGFGQQTGTENGTRKFGAETDVFFGGGISLDLEAFVQENLSSEQTRDYLKAGIRKSFGIISTELGYQYSRDGQASGDDLVSEQGFVGLAGQISEQIAYRLRYEGALGDNDNADFPDRLTVGADYLFGSGSRLYVNQEFSKTGSTSTRNTRIGIGMSPWAGATAHADVNQSQSENGPRVYSSVGIQQKWAVTERLRLDVGFERSDTLRQAQPTNVNAAAPAANGNVSGQTTDDFTAMNVGVGYNAENWSATTRVEARDSERSDKVSWLLGLYTERKQSVGFSLASRLTLTDFEGGEQNRQAKISFGFAFRPRPNRWTILNKLELTYDDILGGLAETSTRKALNNFVVNYRRNLHSQISMNYGAKYVRQTFDDRYFSGYTDLLGLEYRHDFGSGRKWDFGIHGDVLRSRDEKVYDYSFGIELGKVIGRNLRLSAGYNIAGFQDHDLDFGKFRERGPYLSMQFKFDQDTLHELLGARYHDKDAENADPRFGDENAPATTIK